MTIAEIVRLEDNAMILDALLLERRISFAYYDREIAYEWDGSPRERVKIKLTSNGDAMIYLEEIMPEGRGCSLCGDQNHIVSKTISISADSPLYDKVRNLSSRSFPCSRER